MARGKLHSVNWKPIGDGRYRFEWRERVDPEGTSIPGGRRRRKVFQLDSDLAVEAKELEIRAALRDQGRWDAEEAVEEEIAEAPPAPQVTNLEEGVNAYLDHLTGHGLKASTVEQATHSLRRFVGTVRDLEGISAEDGVPGSLLHRELFTRAYKRWKRDGMSEGRRYDIARYAVDLWGWLSDDPERWPGVARPPYNKRNVLPRKPKRTDPPPAPTWEEMDAICRHAKASRSSDLAEILGTCRYTGLRIGQALALRVGDIDGKNNTIAIDMGEAPSTKRMPRIVPCSPHLPVLLAPLVEGKGVGDLIFESRTAGPRQGIYAKTLRVVLEAAEGVGELRPEVWRPRGRKNNRTTHLFRTGVQFELERAGVQDRVVDHLVGHRSQDVRHRHYVNPGDALWDRIRKVVGTIPAIEWGELPDNVVRLRG